MKKITLDEHHQFPGTVRKGKKSELMVAMDELEVNEGIFISNTEWGLKSSPVTRINGEVRRLKSSKKFSGKTVPGEGWSILRIA